MKALVVVNKIKDVDENVSNDVFLALNKYQIEYLSVDFIEFVDNYSSYDFKQFDFIMTIGGDGTIIRISKIAAVYNKPILGINAGHLGFLANVEIENLELLERIKNGNYNIQKRKFLNIQFSVNDKDYSFECLNDVVVSSSALKIIDLSVAVNNDVIDYRADGLIIATPTGSTAYSMSSGGPVIDPAVNGIILTPICQHSLFSRSLVISEQSDIVVNYNEKEHFILSIDGQEVISNINISPIRIKLSNNSVDFIRFDNNSLLTVLAKKLKV